MKKRSLQVVSLMMGACMCLTACSNWGANNAGESGSQEQVKYRITGEANPDVKMMNQPNAPYWFPAELLKWNPTEEKDMDLYVSTVPLKERVGKDKLTPSNSTQNKDFKVAALSIMNASTSGNSPHGLNKFDANTFSYWQYVDQLVYWAGSAGEGLIVPPTADVTDAGHTNGVPVLGTIFLAPEAWGGKLQWLDDFLVMDKTGKFLLVDKLIEAAKTLGFDGWFINQEVEGTDKAPLTKEHADKMLAFVQQFREKADGKVSLIWYDSMTEEGKIDYQNALTDKNDAFLIDANGKKGADSMFLNFWWTKDALAGQNLLKQSSEKAKAIGVNPYDIYAGMDVQENGVRTPIKWNLFAPNHVPYTSLGLYCPSWAYFSAENLDQYEQLENRLWVNEKGNPMLKTEAKDNQWHGVSTYAVEKSVVKSLPFSTNFSLGNGYSFFINGQKVSSLDWNNRSVTDVMPTYRWVLNQEGKNKLKPSFDYANAYYGGNSIKLYGNMEAGKNSELTLYSADFAVTKKTEASVMVKSDHPAAVDMVLEYQDGSKEQLKGDKEAGSEWTQISYEVSKAKGKSIKKLGLSFRLTKESGTAQINLGNITLKEGKAPSVEAPKNVKIAYSQFDDDGIYAGVKLAWDKVEHAKYYEVYKTYTDGSKSFIGVTTASAHYIHALSREEGEKQSTFEVVAVNADLQRSKGNTVVMDWPNISIPKSNLKASKTLVAPGETVQFTSLASQNTTEWEWTFDGANTTTSTEKDPKVTYAKEGVYNVTLVAKNKDGKAECKMEGLIVVRKDAAGKIPVISQGKNVTASSFVNDKEAPKFALDGKTDTKWCATGPAPHDITIDLGEVKTVGEVYMAHAEKGNESPDMNTLWYKIETSLDGTTFEPAIEIKKNAAGETLDTFKPRAARFVKVTAIKPTQGSDSAVRIYEIQVHGLNR